MSARRIMLVVMLNILVATVYAQSPYTSRLGRFQVDQIKGCAPFVITITNVNLITTGECTPGKPCLMDFEGKNQQQQNQFTFTYTTPGTYRLSILYQSIGADDITITVVANTQPDFEIYSCSGNGVSVKVNDNKYQQYLIDFNNDGTPESTQPFTNSIVAQHNYGAAGNYTIAVRGRNVNSADNCTPNRQAFTAIAALPTPTFTALTAIDATSIKLDFPAQSHINLKSEIAVNNAATFQQHQNLYGLTTSTATSLKVDDNYYCFRLNNYDPCTNTNRYSQIMCSHNFDLNIQSAVNRLTWTTGSTGATNITVQRNAQNYSTIPGTPLSFNDIDVVCKTNYCYKVVTNYPGGGRSTSLEKCGESFTTTVLPTLDNISSVVSASQGVDISWNVAPNINTPQFNLFRSGLGKPYSLLTATSTTKVSDPAYVTEEIYCYRIDYNDACGNVSAEGTPFCPIRLSGTLGDKNIAELSWSAYNGWRDGVSRYVIEKYTKAGALISTVDNGTSLSYKDDPADTKNQAIVYVIKAYSAVTGVTVSSSNHVQIVKSTNLFAPTAFTPNGDALNDSFVVTGQYITKLTLKIFDRWGALIFTTEKNEPWNGTRSGTGQPVPEGTYIWKAEMTDESGKIFSEDGTVLVIRKSN
jgi:gliding motility-associated-like protein